MKSDRAEAIRLIKVQIDIAKREYAVELARLNAEKLKLDAEIKKFNEYQTTLGKETQKYIKLTKKFVSQLSKINELNRLIDDLDKEKGVLDTEYSVWVARFAALESDFKKIEDELSKYLKKGENDLEQINALLQEKRLVQDRLFKYTEDKYNSQTHLVDDVNLEMVPSELLENNQRRKLKKEKAKFGKLNDDIASVSKTIQINENEYRKKSFYIFLLTNAFIFLIIILIIVVLMRNGTI